MPSRRPVKPSPSSVVALTLTHETSSEQGDAMIVVTSEETGTISIACKGQLIRNLTDSDLREHLVRYLCGTNNEDKAAVKGIRKLFGGFKK